MHLDMSLLLIALNTRRKKRWNMDHKLSIYVYNNFFCKYLLNHVGKSFTSGRRDTKYEN